MGLQEARIVRFLKQPGDSVERDEPIYEMETDKAVMEIESPSAGVLESWEARENDVLPIGEVVGKLQTEVEVEPAAGADLHLSMADIPDQMDGVSVDAGKDQTVRANAPMTASPPHGR
jgi:pyruvate/2-oxoglutarate dehydrogenase complex dihydrolipoamide acyltransferase (E2) component